jgi:RNA polymerase sigma-70 factor (ECF subfamily)
LARIADNTSTGRAARINSLIEQARAGDHHALGELLERFRPALAKLASQLLSPALAQKVGASDLVQETCLDAMRDFRATRALHAHGVKIWLITLLTNNLKDWQRKFRSAKKRELRRERPLPASDSKFGPAAQPLVSGDSGPASRLVRQESADRVQQGLARLPRGLQQVIVWRTHERRTWQEIARTLDRSEDAVRMLWKRAVERLKRELRELP